MPSLATFAFAETAGFRVTAFGSENDLLDFARSRVGQPDTPEGLLVGPSYTTVDAERLRRSLSELGFPRIVAFVVPSHAITASQRALAPAMAPALDVQRLLESLSARPNPPALHSSPPPRSPVSDTHTVSLESRVLVIEDDPSAGKVTGMLLKMRGYHVVHARDGASGLRLAESDCPGCILMDLGLPDMSGFELLARLRALPALKTCRIIAFTGRTEDEVASGPGSSAFDAVLIKPPEVAELNRHFPSRNGG